MPRERGREPRRRVLAGDGFGSMPATKAEPWAPLRVVGRRQRDHPLTLLRRTLQGRVEVALAEDRLDGVSAGRGRCGGGAAARRGAVAVVVRADEWRAAEKAVDRCDVDAGGESIRGRARRGRGYSPLRRRR